MSNDGILKIFVVSLAGAQKSKAYDVYNGEQPAITHILPIKGKFGQWKQAIIDEIKKKKAKGFVCIVEEKTDHVSRLASQFNLEEMDGEGRSNFYTALDWYFALPETDNLMIAQDYQPFLIRAGGEGQRIKHYEALEYTSFILTPDF